MNRMLWSAAAGAIAMYLFDPQAGRRRRARARDKVDHYQRTLRHACDVTLRDTRQRAAGVRSGLRTLGRRALRRETTPDDKLVGRVRSVLGRYVSHPHAVVVTAQDGRVTLSGPILENEVAPVVKAIRSVVGVAHVENRLTAHREAGGVSSLQGGVPRHGQRFELLQENWSPAARLLTGAVGLALLVRGGILGRLGGAALVARSLSNLDMATLLGVGAPRGLDVQKTICVNAPVEQVFAFWSDYENFPRFMSRVREVYVDEDRSRWVVSGPAGVPVEWTSELVRLEPNSLIEWRSLPGSQVKQDGVVRFEPMEDGGTRVSVGLRYMPPGGALGHAVASVFGADPKSEMDADLMRMKSMIETGHAPHDAAQPV